jgi:hypothetical protein
LGRPSPESAAPPLKQDQGEETMKGKSRPGLKLRGDKYGDKKGMKKHGGKGKI